MAYVDPGELKYRITIEAPARVTTGNDHYEETGPTTFDCWAAKRSSQGKDQFADGAAQSVDTVQFIVRWGTRQRITRGCVILHRGVRYDIEWMDDTPWAEGYARIRAVSYDNSEV